MLRSLVVLAVIAAGGAWYLTRPQPVDPDIFEGLTADAEAGALVFAASGCASCHLAAEVEEHDAEIILTGGRRFASDFGTFIAPNISSDPVAGIGAWSDLDIANAVMQGISPDGAHYYPAFPYSAYSNASPQDILNLVGYLRTLPADQTPNQAHEVGFPFNIRRSVGGWKLFFGGSGWTLEGDDLTPEVERGRYLVEALGHCAECHTPRNALGGLQRGKWLGGAPNPSGTGTIPNITSAALTWSESEIAEYLKSGFTPEFDTAGGEMFDVIGNTSQLSASDRDAIAAYLKAVPPVE